MTVKPAPIISDAYWWGKWDKERLRTARLEAEIERMRQHLSERRVDPVDIATHLTGGGYIKQITEYRCGVCGAVITVSSEEKYLSLTDDGYMNRSAEEVQVLVMGACPKCQKS